jgi:hypothetical protein
MGKQLLRYPFRALGAALTIAGVAVVFVLLILPSVALGRAPGKGGVWWYENDKGNVIQKTGADELLTVVGKNMNHAVDEGNGFPSVWCRDVYDGDSGGWTLVSNAEYGPDSRTLINVDLNNDCAPSSMNKIGVAFDDGSFYSGPRIAVK